MGIWNIEAKFREGDYEATASIEENFNKFFVTNIDFASISKADDFKLSGKMMIELSDMVNKLNGDLNG